MILEKVRNQHVYITLLGPRNETLTGQLNMTDFQSLGRTDPRDAVEPKDPSASTPKFYDSRGAAYYICVFILVYALAIVMFVASLARRRRSYQSGEFSRLPKCEILHYYNNAESALIVRETTDAAERRYSFAKDDDGSAAPRQGTTALRFQRSARANRVVDLTRGKEIGGQGRTVDGCSLPDELITLVQVLPCTDADENPEAYWADGSGSEDNHRHASSSHEQKCRWSIGPDGNLFILQVDENDSSTKFCVEDSHDENGLLKNIGMCRQDLKDASDKIVRDGPSATARIIDRNGVTDNYADCHKNTSASDSRQNAVMSSAEKSTMDGSTINPAEDLTTCTKCDSMLLAEQDCIITDNNYNCDFENPWGLPTCPEIQKLVHVTSV